jgi:hypothetical protein
MAQFGHGPRLDLTDALTGQIEVLAHFLEGAGLTPIQSETEPKDLPLPLVER